MSEETLLNQPGMQPLRDSLLRLALASYDKFLEERQDDPQLRRQVAQAQFYVGRITETVDSPSKALSHYLQAVNIQKQLVEAATGEDAEALTAEYAQSLNAVGKANRICGASTRRGSTTSWRPICGKSLPRTIRTTPRRQGVASSVMNLGIVAELSGQPQEALPLLDRGQALRLAHIARPENAPAKLQRDLGMGYYNLALAHLAFDGAAAAGGNLLKAVRAFEQLAAVEPGDLDNRRRLALCRRMIADGKAMANDIDAAVDFYGQAAEMLRRWCSITPMCQSSPPTLRACKWT